MELVDVCFKREKERKRETDAEPSRRVGPTRSPLSASAPRTPNTPVTVNAVPSYSRISADYSYCWPFQDSITSSSHSTESASGPCN